ncbi:MAG: DoxX family protein [Segetibacter sp.]
MKRLNLFFEMRRNYGVDFLRFVVAWRLIAGVWPCAIQLKPISEVSAFFAQLQLPLPVVSSYLSLYAQFICGLLLIIGLWIRPAAIVMIINFIVAIIAAHLNDGIEKSSAAWVILAASILFLFNGAGKLSIDNWLSQNKN